MLRVTGNSSDIICTVEDVPLCDVAGEKGAEPSAEAIWTLQLSQQKRRRLL